MHKNWPAICRVKNPSLRLLVATTDEEPILEGLRHGFPHLFTDDPTSKPCIPVSVMKEESERYWLEDGCRAELLAERIESAWAPICDKFNIPEIRFVEEEVPRDLVRQLFGQTAHAGIEVLYHGILHLVTDLPVSQMGLKIFEVIGPASLPPTWLHIAPAKFIDLWS